MTIKNLLEHEPQEIYELILQYINKNSIDTKILFDYQLDKFGDLSLYDIVRASYLYSIKRAEYNNVTIEPFSIMATSRHPLFCHKLLKDVFIYKREKVQSLFESLNKNNFFYNADYAEDIDPILYHAINDKQGRKRFITINGNHRSLIAYFLQLIDNSYKLKGVNTIEYIIDWDIVEQKMKLENKYFDYKKFESYFE